VTDPATKPGAFPPSAYRLDRHAWLSRLAAGIVTATVMLLLLEGALRLLWYVAGSAVSRDVGDPVARALQLPERVARSIDGSLRWNIVSDVLTTPDRHLVFRVRPNPSGERIFCYEGIDERGFRNGQRGRSTNSAALLLLGDSCAFGWGICHFDQTISAQLERRLIEEGGVSSPAVFNLAQPGYSSAQALLLLRRWFPKLHPRYVVLYLGWNDRWRTRGLTDAQALRLMPVLASPWARAMTTTAIYRTLAWMVGTRSLHVSDLRRGDQTVPGYRVTLEQSLANFRAMIEQSRRGGATVLIVNLPHASGFPRTKGIEELADALEGAFRHDAEFVALPEMAARSPDARRYFLSDGFHPNAKGARYIAQALVDAILRRSRTDDRDSP
jgi:lysophospholipase L1-like esterase